MLNLTRWKALATILVAAAVCLFAVSIIFPGAGVTILPAWAQHRLVLALNPQGSSSLLLEMDSDYVKKDMLAQIRDDVRYAMRNARVAFRGLVIKPDGVELQIADETKLPAVLAKLSELWQRSGVEVADGGGGGLVTLTVPQTAMAERMRRIVQLSIPVVERRISELSGIAPLVQPQGDNRIRVQVLGRQNAGRLKELLGKTAKLELRIIDTTVSPEQAQQGKMPPDCELLMSATSPKIPYVVKKQVLVSGGDLTDAQPGFDQRSGEAIVNFRFNTAGSRKFASATIENVGQPFAIVLDNEVISAPVIREPITGGSGQISGNFTVQQANDLAILFRAGALPAPLTVIEDRSRI